MLTLSRSYISPEKCLFVFGFPSILYFMVLVPFYLEIFNIIDSVLFFVLF